MIADHLQGLPSYFNMAFSNYDILQIGKVWGADLSTEEKEDDLIEQWWLILGMNIIKLFKENNLQFDGIV